MSVCLQSQPPGICDALDTSNTTISGETARWILWCSDPSFSSGPALIAGAEHLGAGRAGLTVAHLHWSSQFVCVQFRVLRCASSLPQTTCLSTKASTDKQRKSDLAIWPGFKDFVLQAECLACRRCQINGSCSHTHWVGRIRGDEMFLFAWKLRWVLTHVGQQASVTFAQEEAVMIANLSEEAQWVWVALVVRWDPAEHQGHRLFQVRAATGCLCAPVCHRELHHCCHQAAGLVTQKPFGTSITLTRWGVTFSIASNRQRAWIIEVFE